MLAGIYQVGVFYSVYPDEVALSERRCGAGYIKERIARAHDIKFSRHSGAGYRELIPHISFRRVRARFVLECRECDAELSGYRYHVSAPDGVYFFFAVATRWQSYSQPLAREYPVGVNYPVLSGYRPLTVVPYSRYRPERVAGADIYRERPCSRADRRFASRRRCANESERNIPSVKMLRSTLP